ncbi:hypothetical protein L873DRAFT_1812912 [Choiromyces venosus 120613-1]|uniref:Uncharacterized protein n=1 Tax=Choiromyces venosus 120613-1 TaxID=1336337 RepID=A0A3N4JB08_9PEZI|nr:hypothetical protein L873DRAFT_1812912 [Choiromyces venosus 120613-1]
MPYCKVGVDKSAKPDHFPYKIIKKCAKSNVPTTAPLIILQPVWIQSSKGSENQI